MARFIGNIYRSNCVYCHKHILPRDKLDRESDLEARIQVYISIPYDLRIEGGNTSQIDGNLRFETNKTTLRKLR